MLSKTKSTISRADGLRIMVSALLAILIAVPTILLEACTPHQSEGAYDSVNREDCLPDVPLVDQNGKTASLATLKGKPVLVDFIYTSCPGPCLMITAKMENVALRLGSELGSKVRLVSISVDPEHDGPKQMLDYAQKQGADQNGWLFLTGSPTNIDRVLAAFKMSRQRDEDGSVGHLVGVFLLGADGKQIRQYSGTTLKPETVAADIKKVVPQNASS
jgi:protein SCO1/2